MSKFLYTYDVIRVDNGRAIAVGFEGKVIAERLTVIAINNVPGRVFKVRQKRTANPNYVAV